MSNQFLNSESIFEIIGDYPVVDQFDILYAKLQSGSYLDNYVTGTLPNRGRLFSKLNNSPSQLPSPKESPTVINSYEYQLFREKSGIVRNVKMFSEDERFYDSLMPNIGETVKVLGGLPIKESTRRTKITIEIGRPLVPFASLAVGFVESYPFEPKFSKVGRMLKINHNIVAAHSRAHGLGNYATTGIEEYSTNVIGIIEHEVALDELTDKFTYWESNSKTTDPYPPGLTEHDISKILFGFGDRKSIRRTETSTLIRSSGLCEYRRRYDATDSYVVGPIIRGWKYGVYDGMPHYSNCVFRRDRFGQFRDMLEQRLQSTSYIDSQNSPSVAFNVYEGKPISTMSEIKNNEYKLIEKSKNNSKYYDFDINGVVVFPIEVKFVQQQQNGDYIPISPDKTRSSNLSQYFTSSMPFFDLDKDKIGKNTTIIPDSLINNFELLTSEIDLNLLNFKF